MRKLAMLLVATGSLAMSIVSPIEAQDVGLAIGTRVAPISIENLDGTAVNLAQFIGRRPVVLEFWAHWCTVCAELEPRLRAAETRYKANVEFITVAVGVNQTVRSIRRHLEGHAVPGRMLFDKDGRATRAFDAPATSYIVILDRQGRVAYTGVGADQDLNTAIARVAAAR